MSIHTVRISIQNRGGAFHYIFTQKSVLNILYTLIYHPKQNKIQLELEVEKRLGLVNAGV